MLDKDRFLSLVDAAPLVAMDLVVVRGGSELLLGQRNNRPAQGWWFVPGGRIHKNETMHSALQRVAKAELGLDLSFLLKPPESLGAFEHFYDDCFAGDLGVSTHYVVMGNLLNLPASAELPTIEAQHSRARWWPLAEAAESAQVHRFTKDYVAAVMQRQSCGALA